MTPTTVTVCTRCTRARPGDPGPGHGLRLYRAALRAAEEDPRARGAVRVRAVSCMSHCPRSCTAALSAPGKATLVLGDLDPDAGHEELLAGALLHAACPRGQPDLPGVVARIGPARAQGDSAAT